MKAKPVTMRDVARRLGVSQSTVSLALNNSPLLPPGTRERVRRVAGELGYRVHPYVSALMRSRRPSRAPVSRPMLAVINTLPTRTAWRSSSIGNLKYMLLGAERQALERNYQTSEFWLHEPEVSHERLSDILRARGIVGVLLGPSSDLYLDLKLKWEYFSVVRLGSTRFTPALHRVVNDHFVTAGLAVRQCFALGYRRPGLVVRTALSVGHERRWEAGVEMAARDLAGVTLVPTLLMDDEADARQFARWFHRYRPDVVLDGSESTALGHARAMGLKVPQDVGIASLSAPEPGGELSGTYQHGEAMGVAATNLLISLIERNETGIPALPVTQSTGSLWNPGRTVRQVGPRGTA